MSREGREDGAGIFRLRFSSRFSRDMVFPFSRFAPVKIPVKLSP
jgi:hypothetical protein